MKIRRVRAKLFMRTDSGHIANTKLIIAFRNFVNKPKNE